MRNFFATSLRIHSQHSFKRCLPHRQQNLTQLDGVVPSSHSIFVMTHNEISPVTRSRANTGCVARTAQKLRFEVVVATNKTQLCVQLTRLTEFCVLYATTSKSLIHDNADAWCVVGNLQSLDSSNFSPSKHAKIAVVDGQ